MLQPSHSSDDDEDFLLALQSLADDDYDDDSNKIKTVNQTHQVKGKTVIPRKKKGSNKMDQAEWDAAIPVVHDLLLDQSRDPCQVQVITEADFKVEDDGKGQGHGHGHGQSDHIRVSLPSKLRSVCKKLPWFHKVVTRFRQTLAKKRRHGITLQDVIRAMNFLFRRAYSADEIEFLLNYFQRMEIPLNAECLTTIVEVSEDFSRYLATATATTTVAAVAVSK
jgi:hypothetical protein